MPGYNNRASSTSIGEYWAVPKTAGARASLTVARPAAAPDEGVTLELSVSLRSLADGLAAERDWRDRIARSIMPVDVPAIGAFTSAQLPYLQGTWGPNDGFTWAVQRITVGQLLSTDSMLLYRGASTADASGNQNLLQGFQGSAGPVQVWNPGRTGCMLAKQQNIIITGTLTGGPYTLNADVIQLESWLLPYFLL
jgi:hypothetical protein